MGSILKITGPVVIATDMKGTRMFDVVKFSKGNKKIEIDNDSLLFKEVMGNGSGYYNVAKCDLTPANFREATVARDLNDVSFNLIRKHVELPTDNKVIIHDIPAMIDYYDNELMTISKLIT
jgi:hypothetical protein